MFWQLLDTEGEEYLYHYSLSRFILLKLTVKY